MMCINLSSSWVFRKVVVKCLGAETVIISAPSLSGPVRGEKFVVPMERLNANDFIFDAKLSIETYEPNIKNKILSYSENNNDGKINFLSGNQLLLTFEKSNLDFVALVSVKIVVVPYVAPSPSDLRTSSSLPTTPPGTTR